MAPRRTRKVGLKRIDAAIDKFTAMGFSPSSIRRKVKYLLALYGGNDGWVFIEDGDYNVLLEALLVEQGKQDAPLLTDGCSRGEKDDYSQDESGVQEGFEGQTELSGAGPSSWAIVPVCSKQDAKLANPEPVDILLPPSLGEQKNLSGSSARRRRRFLGWISTDKDDNDFVLLTPYPVHSDRIINRKKECVRRWDLGPSDTQGSHLSST